MEFNYKLQELRKQKNITQEELAKMLCVSRTAISKWESGRGYPNITSLKDIANFFNLTIDELLSSEELLTIAEEDTRDKNNNLCDLLFGLLDCSIVLLLFLPFFAQKNDGIILEGSLLSLTELAFYLRIAYFAVVIGILSFGILTLALQNSESLFWIRNKSKISLALNMIGILLFVISTQPYAAVFLLSFIIIKAFMLIKKK